MFSSQISDADQAQVLIVSRPVICVYSAATFRSEMVTQEIIGRKVFAEESMDGWLRCRLSDGYPGWVPSSGLFNDPGFKPTHFVCRRFAKVTIKDGNTMILPFGGYVEVVSIEGSKCQIKLPGQAMVTANCRDFQPLSSLPYQLGMFKRIVKEVIGTSYLWGGKSTFGFDCSGLVQFIYELLGKKLPRDSCDQAKVGDEVYSIAMAEPLDLFFFGSYGKVDHVAIHLGNLDILHASGFVRVESLKPSDERFRKDLADKILSVRRLRVD